MVNIKHAYVRYVRWCSYSPFPFYIYNNNTKEVYRIYKEEESFKLEKREGTGGVWTVFKFMSHRWCFFLLLTNYLLCFLQRMSYQGNCNFRPSIQPIKPGDQSLFSSIDDLHLLLALTFFWVSFASLRYAWDGLWSRRGAAAAPSLLPPAGSTYAAAAGELCRTHFTVGFCLRPPSRLPPHLRRLPLRRFHRPPCPPLQQSPLHSPHSSHLFFVIIILTIFFGELY